jgi:hypothetical protein
MKRTLKRTARNVIKKKSSSFKSLKNKKAMCSPKEKNESNPFSCFTNTNIYKMKDLWNKNNLKNKITTNNIFEIWKELNKYISQKCDNELCWLSQPFLNKNYNEFIKSFAPIAPKEWKKNKNEWLSNIDILKVMKQYEDAYKCFKFFGPAPIDFNNKVTPGKCVENELCNININTLVKNKKTKIGIIFNTDPHYKGGEHWISLFINLKTGLIYFFDSVGKRVLKQIFQLVNNITEQGKKMKPPIHFKFDQNYPVEHQYGGTECGVYSIYFIINMLKDTITGDDLKNKILTDKYIENYRKIYFNHL